MSWARAIRVAIIALSAGALVFALRGLDLHATLASIRNVNPWLGLAAAALMLLGKTGLKSVRTHVLLREVAARARVPPPPPAVTARLVLASHAAGQLAWGPLGYTIRSVALRDEGLPLTAVAREFVAERIAEAMGLAVVAAVALAVAPSAIASSWLGIVLVAALGAGLSAAAAIAASRRLRARLRSYAGSGRALVTAAGWALASSFADAGVLALGAAAAHVDVPLPAVLVAFLAVNGATAVPSTPAQLGVQETAIVVAFAAAGVPAPAALAAALAYRAAHVAPMVLFGLPALLATWLRRGRA